GDPLLVLADQDVRQPRVRELVRDVLADLDVLEDVVRELLLAGVPVGLPVVDDAHAEPAGGNLLAHQATASSVFLRRVAFGLASAAGVSSVVAGASACFLRGEAGASGATSSRGVGQGRSASAVCV